MVDDETLAVSHAVQGYAGGVVDTGPAGAADVRAFGCGGGGVERRRWRSALIEGLATGSEYLVRVLGLNRGDAGEQAAVALSTPADSCAASDVRARVTVLEGGCDRTLAVRDADACTVPMAGVLGRYGRWR